MNGEKTKSQIDTKYIIKFALPIVAGNVLQQTYQIVSSVIVGRCCGENSLAALGVSTPIVSVAVFFMIGTGVGLTVLLSKHFGEEDMEKYREVAYTARKTGIIFAVLISLIAIIFAENILVLCRTPELILAEAAFYLRIMFAGLTFTFLYNYYNSCYLSIGKSRIPFYALSIAAVINVFLSLLLIWVLDLGIMGAAVSSITAQGFSVLFCAIYARRKVEFLILPKSELAFEKKYLYEIISYSGASAIQHVIFIVGRIIIQGGVNTLGISVIAGYNAAANLESLVIAPCDSIAGAIAALIALEYGRKDYNHIIKTTVSGLRICAAYAIFAAALLFFFSPYLIPLFLSESSEVMISTGTVYLRWMILGYAILTFPEIFQAFLRGVGLIRLTLYITTLQIVTRVALTYLLIYHLGIKAVSIATTMGWIVMALFGFIALQRYRKRENI